MRSSTKIIREPTNKLSQTLLIPKIKHPEVLNSPSIETPMASGKDTPDVLRRDSKFLKNNSFTAEMV